MVKVMCQVIGCILKPVCQHDKCGIHCPVCDPDAYNQHRKEEAIVSRVDDDEPNFFSGYE